MDNLPSMDQTGLDFKSFVKSKTKRVLERVELNGFAMIYNDAGEFIVKAVLRNISFGGFGVEIPECSIKPNDKVRVMLAGVGVSLGSVPCVAKWVADLHQADGTKNLVVGFEITKKTPQFKEVYDKFVDSILLKKHTTTRRRVNAGRTDF